MNLPLSELEKVDINALLEEFVETIYVQNKAYALSDYREQFERYLEKSDHKGTLFFEFRKKIYTNDPDCHRSKSKILFLPGLDSTNN